MTGVFMDKDGAFALIRSYRRAADDLEATRQRLGPLVRRAAGVTGQTSWTVLATIQGTADWADWTAGDLSWRLQAMARADATPLHGGPLTGPALPDRPFDLRNTSRDDLLTMLVILGPPRTNNAAVAGLLAEIAHRADLDRRLASDAIDLLGPDRFRALSTQLRRTLAPRAAPDDVPPPTLEPLAMLVSTAAGRGEPDWLAGALFPADPDSWEIATTVTLLTRTRLEPALADRTSRWVAGLPSRLDHLDRLVVFRAGTIAVDAAAVPNTALAALAVLLLRHPDTLRPGPTPALVIDALMSAQHGVRADEAAAAFLTAWFVPSRWPDSLHDLGLVAANVKRHGLPGPATAAALATVMASFWLVLAAGDVPSGVGGVPDGWGNTSTRDPAFRAMIAALHDDDTAAALLLGGLASATHVLLLWALGQYLDGADDAVFAPAAAAIGHMHDFIFEALENPPRRSIIRDVLLALVSQATFLLPPPVPGVIGATAAGIGNYLEGGPGRSDREEIEVYEAAAAGGRTPSADDLAMGRLILAHNGDDPAYLTRSMELIDPLQVVVVSAILAAGRDRGLPPPDLPPPIAGSDGGLADPLGTPSHAAYAFYFNQWLDGYGGHRVAGHNVTFAALAADLTIRIAGLFEDLADH